MYEPSFNTKYEFKTAVMANIIVLIYWNIFIIKESQNLGSLY